MADFVTKDSGERQQFDSGMVRDTMNGKERYDLVFDGPLTRELFVQTSIELLMLDWYHHPTLEKGARVIAAVALREGGTWAYLDRCRALMERGAVKYAVRNWMLAKGQAEKDRFKESASRHCGKYLRGDRDEDHAAAVWFNINGYHYVTGAQ